MRRLALPLIALALVACGDSDTPDDPAIEACEDLYDFYNDPDPFPAKGPASPTPDKFVGQPDLPKDEQIAICVDRYHSS